MKKFAVILLIFGSFVFSIIAQALQITTMNIRLYGIGGVWAGGIEDEFRDRTLKQFILQNLSKTDVFLFEEIVDVSRLQNLMKSVDSSFQCTSYNWPHENGGSGGANGGDKHQYIALCYKTNIFQFYPDSSSKIFDVSGFAYWPVAKKKYRPALVGILENIETNEKVRIIGVHLKALAESSAIRLEQISMIKDYINSFNDTTQSDNNKRMKSTIILGDFNTANEDLKNIERILLDIVDISFARLDQDFLFTFKSYSGQVAFDHIFISNDIYQKCKMDGYFCKVTTAGPCDLTMDANEGSRNVGKFLDFAYYYQFISDHCPVTLETNYSLPLNNL